MKKIISYILGISVALTSCQKKTDDLIQNKTSDERLSAALAQYQSILTKAPYGWKIVETSGVAFNNGASDSTKATFVYYMQFTDSNTVKMFGSFDTVQAKVPKTSGYRITGLQRPTLIFDTYSYIHVPCDPDPSVSKSPLSAGSGWGTDYEFMFVDNVAPDKLGDTIRLAGLKNSATAFMVKATKDEQTIVNSGQYAANLNVLRSKFLTYWQRFTIGSTVYELPVIDFNSKIVTINWLDASGNLQTFRSQFWTDFDGSIVFVQPFVNGNVTITGFTANLGLVGTNVPATVTISPSIVPLKLDVTAAQKWYTQMGLNFNNCWVSDKAFHVNGVDDFCKFGSISTTTNTQLWYAGPAVFGGTNEGIVPFNTTFVLTYCFSKVPFTVNAGIARFTLLSSSGTFTGSTASAVAMTSARNIMYNGATVNSFQDWYFVPTSSTGKNYDMVRVSDALAWISWRPR
ncbi:DUF4302 domain-containing protein [Chitinophagaceae bacterium LWZ2-11]